MSEHNKLIIVTAPSGSGKTTIVRHLMQTFSQLAFSVSATTRPIRDYEVDGKDYHFLDNETFFKCIEEGKFVEWEEVYEGRYYGTLKSEVDRIMAAGQIPVFDIEVIGAQDIQTIYPQAFSIFVQPPSIAELKRRLLGRKTEDEESLKKRLDRAVEELKLANKFDQILVNDQLEVALVEADIIVALYLGMTEEE